MDLAFSFTCALKVLPVNATSNRPRVGGWPQVAQLGPRQAHLGPGVVMREDCPHSSHSFPIINLTFSLLLILESLPNIRLQHRIDLCSSSSLS